MFRKLLLSLALLLALALPAQAALIYADRVSETTTTTGTGTYSLAGAVTGYQPFSVIGNGNTAYYAATDGTNWEVGLGTFATSGDTLARTIILASSNAGAAVSWGAGSKSIYLDLPASAIAQFAPATGKTLTVNNSLTFTGTDGTTMSFPGTSDAVATLGATQTLTNKTISGANNTLTNIGNGSLTNPAATVNSQTCTLGSTCTVTAAPSGSAGGDLSGTYPNPGVAKLNGTALSGLATGILKNTTSTGVPSIAANGTDYIAPGYAQPPGTVGGRLTAATNTPVMSSSVTGATSVFFTGYKGNYIPIWNGSTFVDVAFTSDLSQALSDTTKSPAAAAANSVYDIFAWVDSGTLRISRGPAWSTLNVRGSSANISNFRGIPINDSAITNGPAAVFGTYLGTIATNGSATLDFIHGGLASGGSPASLMLWNYWNRLIDGDYVFDSGTSYTYSTSTWRQARASTGNQIAFLVGVQEDAYSMFYQQNVTTTASAGAKTQYGISVGAGSLSITPAAANEVIAPTAATFSGSVPVFWSALPTIGYNIEAAIEWGDGSHANSICVYGGAQLSFQLLM